MKLREEHRFEFTMAVIVSVVRFEDFVEPLKQEASKVV